MTPAFIATHKFDQSDGERWANYFEWAKIPRLSDLVSLDGSLSGSILPDLTENDWPHIDYDFPTYGFFRELSYLINRTKGISRRNVLGVLKNPDSHIQSPPFTEPFIFAGYDLIEDATSISAMTNCGGFPEVFDSHELNHHGLLDSFQRAAEIQIRLKEQYSEEPHADCELYAIWRLNETEQGAAANPYPLRGQG